MVGVDVPVDVLLDTLTTVYSGIKIVTPSDIGVDILAGVDANLLAAVASAFTFIVPASLAEFCVAASSCWPIVGLNRTRVLHALIPSYHV